MTRIKRIEHLAKQASVEMRAAGLPIDADMESATFRLCAGHERRTEALLTAFVAGLKRCQRPVTAASPVQVREKKWWRVWE